MRGVKRIADYQTFDEWSPRMAYLLGFAFADGHLTPSPRHTLVYTFGVKSDLLPVVCGLMRSALEGKVVRGQNGNSIQTRYSDVRMHQRLLELGLPAGRKGTDLQYPYVPNQVARHFVRGYFDGDGTAHMNPNAQSKLVSFNSISLPFLEALRDWFRSVACRGGIYRNPRELPRHDLYQLWFARKQCRQRIFRLLYCDIPKGQYSLSKGAKFLEVAQLQRAINHPAFWDTMRQELEEERKDASCSNL